MKTLRHAVSILVAIFAINSFAHGQAMVDLAKKERQRQQSKQSTTVLNGDAVHGAPASVAAGTAATATQPPAAAPAPSTASQGPAAPAAPAATAQKPATTGPVDNKGRDEKY